MILFTHYPASILLSPSPFFTLAKQISLSQFSDYSPYAKKTSSSSLAWLTTPSLIYTPPTFHPHLLPLLPPPWVWQVKETAPHLGRVVPRHTPFTSTLRPLAGALSLQSFPWLGQQLLNTEPQLRKKKVSGRHFCSTWLYPKYVGQPITWISLFGWIEQVVKWGLRSLIGLAKVT